MAKYRNADGEVDEEWHWRTELWCITTGDLFSLCYSFELTFMDIVDIWHALIPMTKPHNREMSGRLEKRMERSEEWTQKKNKAIDVFGAYGIPVPRDKEMFTTMVRFITDSLASMEFISKTPEPILAMAVQLGHDAKEMLWRRTEYDHRLTFNWAMLNRETFEEVQKDLGKEMGSKTEMAYVEQHYRCTAKVYATYYIDSPEKLQELVNMVANCPHGQVALAKKGEEDMLGSFPEAEGKMRHAENQHGDKLDADKVAEWCQFDVDSFIKSASGKTIYGVNLVAKCGLTQAAKSGWLNQKKEKNLHSRTKWGCAGCRGNWKGGAGGSRQLNVFFENYIMQFIVDEPPDKAYRAWQIDRMEYYKRKEPTAALLDVAPTAPQGKTLRYIVKGAASDALWERILSTPSDTAVKAINDIVQKQMANY